MTGNSKPVRASLRSTQAPKKSSSPERNELGKEKNGGLHRLMGARQ